MERKDVVYFVQSCENSETSQNRVFSICVGEWFEDSELHSLSVIDLNEGEDYIASFKSWRKVELNEIPFDNAVELIEAFCSELKSICFRCENDFLDEWKNCSAQFEMIYEFAMKYFNFVLPSLSENQILQCRGKVKKYFAGEYIGGKKEVCKAGKASKKDLEIVPDLVFIQPYRFLIGWLMENLLFGVENHGKNGDL